MKSEVSGDLSLSLDVGIEPNVEAVLFLYNCLLIHTGFVIDAAVFKDWGRYGHYIRNIKHHC